MEREERKDEYKEKTRDDKMRMKRSKDRGGQRETGTENMQRQSKDTHLFSQKDRK